ncbi:hypothetical protein NKH77_54865 [Streptomyces sp. M19]
MSDETPGGSGSCCSRTSKNWTPSALGSAVLLDPELPRGRLGGVLLLRRRQARDLCQGLTVEAHHARDEMPALDVLLHPGGRGTRPQLRTPATWNGCAPRAGRCRS